jgi:hypothetical protein
MNDLEREIVLSCLCTLRLGQSVGHGSKLGATEIEMAIQLVHLVNHLVNHGSTCSLAPVISSTM